MRLAQAHVGAVVCDSLPFSQGGTLGQAQALAADGVHAVAGYLGAMTRERLGFLHAAGLAFTPVTFGGEYEDGPLDEVAQLKALGVPMGTTVWLDMEGLKAFNTVPAKLIGEIREWASGIAAAGFDPKLYVGVPQPLTSEELYALPVRGYWKGQGSVRDRNHQLAEPQGCGWMMTQMWPSVQRGRVLVDCNMVGQDFKRRTFSWVIA